MTTEKSFVESNQGFWHDLLPLGEVYLRRLNRSVSRFVAPMSNVAASGERGVVNELGFRLFVRFSRLKQNEPVWTDQVVREEAAAALRYVARMRQFGRVTPSAPTGVGLSEAQAIAERLLLFFKELGGEEIICAPSFRGCGWIADCCGDVFSEGVLFEVKAGDRAFRGIDLRQMMCYPALNFASKQREIHSLCLVNPRHGTYFYASLNDVCHGLAGKSSVELLSSIVDYVSEPMERYLG